MTTLDELAAFAKNHAGFNDFELWAKPDAARTKELLGREVDGLVAFGEHGSGSLYATYRGCVVWLDSEGEQFTLAGSIDDFIAALHVYAGSLYDAMASCQAENPPPADELRHRFGASWLKRSTAHARTSCGASYAAFTAWAATQNLSAPENLVDRLIALRETTRALRAAAAGKA